MTALRVSEEIFRAFPDVLIGVVVFEGVRNADESAEIVGDLRREEERVAAEFAAISIPDHPCIAPWRAAYRAFGARPKDHPSSIENLVRRAVKGQRLPHVNRIVDLYNAVSLRRLSPIGGEDLEKVEGDVELVFAGPDEPPVRLLGEPEARPPKPGEVIYRDRVGALCRRWNWREAERTKLTEETRRGFLVVEALPPVDRVSLDEISSELADLIARHCGGIVRTAVVDRENPITALSGGREGHPTNL